jgi:hypothetical protein
MRPETLTDFRKLGKKRLAPRTAEEAKVLHDKRKAAKTEEAVPWMPWMLQGRPYAKNGVRNVRNIPLGIHRIPPTAYTHAKNWNQARPTSRHSHAAQINEGRYSSRCTFTHYTYTQYIESWGLVVGGTLRACIDLGAQGVKTFLLRPWRGWRWHIDDNGICLKDGSGKRDYHPTASDLIMLPTTKQMAEAARLGYEQRKEAAALEREMRNACKNSEREGLSVCLSDSLAAGNCRAGTLNWAQRHGFVAGHHYKPSQLLAMSNGDTPRVRIVIAKALQRHRQEMRQGYADLAYHTAR